MPEQPTSEPDDLDTRDQEPGAVGTSGEPPADPWGQLRTVLFRRPGRAQFLIAILCALLGFGFVLQVRVAADEASLSSARPEDLVRLLDSLEQRGDRLDAEVADLEETRDRLESARDLEAAAAQERRQRENDLGVLAGTLAAQGPGVEVGLSGPVDAGLVLNTVQELRDAGAEAMQIDDVRVVASTSFLDGVEPGIVVIDGVEVATPITILAIGNAQTMASALRIPGGVVDSASADDVAVTITERDPTRVTAVVPLASPEVAQPSD